MTRILISDVPPQDGRVAGRKILIKNGRINVMNFYHIPARSGENPLPETYQGIWTTRLSLGDYMNAAESLLHMPEQAAAHAWFRRPRKRLESTYHTVKRETGFPEGCHFMTVDVKPNWIEWHHKSVNHTQYHLAVATNYTPDFDPIRSLLEATLIDDDRGIFLGSVGEITAALTEPLPLSYYAYNTEKPRHARADRAGS